MWKLLPIIILFGSPAARADLTHRLSTSTQLTVNGAATAAERIGSTYTVSGTNIKVGTGNSDVFGGLTSGSATAAATMKAGTYDINTSGSAFSFSESWLQGDGIAAIGSGVDVTSGVVADMPAYGNTTTQSGGVAGTLAGTITSAGVMTLTAGGAGTTATGQFVSEVVVD
tara:strand:- start:1121 stop:1630 length:510 start_codon:yes stop_codon:yes gene_type:complete